VVIGLVVVAGLLVWVGLLILDDWSNRRAERLIDRLHPYRTLSRADQKHRWLDNR
jgi:hypothetical protein